MTKIALIATSILSVVFLSTTIMEHNKAKDIAEKCTTSPLRNIKVMKGIIDSTKPDNNVKIGL